MMTCAKYHAFLVKIQGLPNGIRPGQHIMNTLEGFDPEAYSKLNETEADCKYQDSKIPKTLLMLAEMWKDRGSNGIDSAHA